MAAKSEWKGTPSWWKYSGRLLAVVAFVAGAVALLSTDFTHKGLASGFLAFVAFAVIVSVLWSKFSSRYRISNGTLSATYGLLSQETHEIDVRDVKDMVLRQSLAGRIFNYGTLEFSSAGRDTAEVIFEDIPDPKSVKQLVTGLKREVLGSS